MRFFKGNLERIADVEIFPIISLLIFFGFFVALLIYVFSKNKETYEEAGQIPLEGENENEEID